VFVSRATGLGVVGATFAELAEVETGEAGGDC
jgi:hypothetical protein